MSFQNPLGQQAEDSINEINMTPLVDVMLVLLIIFMITMPVVTHSVQVELPVASSESESLKAESVTLEILKDESIRLDNQIVSLEDLTHRLPALAAQTNPPEVRIQADSLVPYGAVAQVMALANASGLHKLGFVTLPE